MTSRSTALPATSKHTPRSPVNLSVRAGHDTPASLTAPANQKSRPLDTANTEKDVTALVRASPYAPKTDALVVVAVAHLQPTQQQRKHANRVRHSAVAGAGAADGTHRVDRPRAHPHQPSPSPDARRTHPTCRSQTSAQPRPYAPASTQTYPKSAWHASTLTALNNKESLPPDTANTEKHVTTLTRASLGTHTTAALVGAAVAHLQPTQQQRKHANWVRNGLTAGLGAADGTHRVDRPRAHQHQPSPSPDARGTCPTCRSHNNARALPHAPVTTQTQQKKHPSPPAPKPLAPTTRRQPQQLANFEAAKAAGRSTAAPCHHSNAPAATRLVAQLLTENAAHLLAATRAPENRPICRSPSLRKTPTKVRLETRQACPPLRVSPPPTKATV